MKAEEEFLDVLQNIEFGIIRVYRRHAALLDHDVHDAIEGAIRWYSAEERGQHPPALRLSQRAQDVFESVQAICEWRLGRGAPVDGDEPPQAVKMTPRTVGEMLLCLRRIEKSIRRWSKQGGRQGYLNFIGQFLP